MTISPQNVPLVLRSPDLQSPVHLGQIVLSTVNVKQVRLLLENNETDHVSISVGVSESLQKLLFVQQVVLKQHISLFVQEPHHLDVSPLSDTVEHVTSPESLFNINFLHHCLPKETNVLLPPRSRCVVHVSLCSKLSLPREAIDTQIVSIPVGPHQPSSLSGCLTLSSPTLQESLSLEISAETCHSVIRPHTHMLDFGHCILSQEWLFRELIISNVGQVDTSFIASVSVGSGSHSLEDAEICVMDAESGDDVAFKPIAIPQLTTRTLRIGIRPQQAGNFNQYFAIQNAKNAMDIANIQLLARVTSEELTYALSLSCGSELDFGNCYASQIKSRDIVATNLLDDTLTLQLTTDQKHQVSMEVVQAWSPALSKLHDLHVEEPMSTSSKKLPVVKQVSLDTMPPSPMPSLGRVSMSGQSPIVVSDNDSFSDFDRQSWPSNFSERLPAHNEHESNEQTLAVMSSKVKNGSPESVALPPKQEVRIRVWYLPLLPDELGDDEEDLARGKLQDAFFQLRFEMVSGESRSVIGRAKVCESILRLEKEMVHLGDCNVLTRYQSSFTIRNCSDLVTWASISYVSQCVLAHAHEVRIPARECVEVGLDFVPRRVNPGYHKELTITNRRNRGATGLMFTLRANCVDDQGLSLHALYYRVLAPNPTNEVDFGVTVANHAALRAMRIKNLTDSRLTLEFSCDHGGVKTFIPFNSRHGRRFKRYNNNNNGDNSGDYEEDVTLSYAGTRDRISECAYVYLPCAPDGIMRKRASNIIEALIDRPMKDGRRRIKCQLSGGRVKKNGARGGEMLTANGTKVASRGEKLGDDWQFCKQDTDGAREGSWAAFLKCLEERDFAKMDAVPLYLSNDEMEKKHTERQFGPSRRLGRGLEEGYLVEKKEISIEGGGESIVVIRMVLSDRDVRGKTKMRPIEKHLRVGMVDMDDQWIGRAMEKEEKNRHGLRKVLEMGNLRVSRDVLLTVQACKSVMKISPLRQLNFGVVWCGEQRDQAFTIVNESEAALLYEVRTGTGCKELRLNVGTKTQGVVRAYFNKVVSFNFVPSKAGRFEGKIFVNNRLDSSAGCEVVVKAFVRSKECGDSSNNMHRGKEDGSG